MPPPLSLVSRGASSRLAKTFPPTVVAELATIERDLGGRAAIVGMLALAPLTPDLRYLLGLLGDPLNAQQSLAELCAVGNTLPGDLLKQLASAALLRGKVRASQTIGEGIAAVTTDVMRRAAPYEAACHTCLGVGKLTDDPTPAIPNPLPQPCTTCNGTGTLLYQPDLERQKLAVDLAQLLPKSGGINIAQINQAAGGQAWGSGGGSLELVQQLTDKLLYASEGTPLDADLVEGAEPPAAPAGETEEVDGPAPE
jgi:hypothetical protein